MVGDEKISAVMLTVLAAKFSLLSHNVSKLINIKSCSCLRMTCTVSFIVTMLEL